MVSVSFRVYRKCIISLTNFEKTFLFSNKSPNFVSHSRNKEKDKLQ